MTYSSRRSLAPALLLVLALLALAAARSSAAPPASSPLSAQPSAQDFGTVRVDWGEQSTSLWIQNTGADPVQVGTTSVDGDAAFRVSGDGCQGQQLAGGQGCSVWIGFDPSDSRAYAATLHVPADGFADLEVPLGGVGGAQQVSLAPAALDFGALAVGASAVRSFTLTSVGTIPFGSFVTIPSGGDVGAFRVERDGCSLQQLAPNAPCEVAVRFTPPSEGRFDAMLLLIGGDSEPAVVPLHGSGTAASGAPATAPTAQTATTLPPVGIAFDVASGLPAPFGHGRVDLGRARCVGAERCTVVVRARVYALGLPASGVRTSRHRAGMSSARTDAILWNLRASGGRARFGLPAGLRGTPALLVATLRTHAAGRRSTTRTLVAPLVARSPAREARARVPLGR